MGARSRRAAVLITAAIAIAGGALFAQDFFRRGERDRDTTELYGNVEYDGRLTFVRIRYSSGLGRGFGRRGSRGELPWAHDYPTADTHMMKIMAELSITPARTDGSNVLELDDPELFNYPIAYMSEPGFWMASDEEVEGLRKYLLKGGFIIFDDFRGGDWYNLQEQMRRVLPDHRFILLDGTHAIFNSFFDIKRFDFGYYGQEHYYGIFEDNDPGKRMMAVAGLNQDLGEYWEYSDTGWIPIDLSNEAYKFGMNFYIYGLTH